MSGHDGAKYADIPGVKKENLEVSLTDNMITLKGSTSEERRRKRAIVFAVKP